MAKKKTTKADVTVETTIEQALEQPTEQGRFIGGFTGSKGQGFEMRKIPSGGVDLRILHRNKVKIHISIGEEMLAQLKLAFSRA